MSPQSMRSLQVAMTVLLYEAVMGHTHYVRKEAADGVLKKPAGKKGLYDEGPVALSS